MTQEKEATSDSLDRGIDFCTLPPPELHDRLTMIRREIAPLVRKAEKLPRGRAWTFARDAVLQSKLESLVAIERRCCRGLVWNMDVGEHTLRLRLEGIDPEATFFESFDVVASSRGTGCPATGDGWPMT
jgi:hypothetical protein